MAEIKHTRIGIASIFAGILGLILFASGLFFYSFVDNRLYGIIFGLISGLIAILLGTIAKKEGDEYGTYGIILGSLVLIIGILTFLFTTITSVEVGRTY